jgi:pentatricopeptide repeat-containing protein PET309
LRSYSSCPSEDTPTTNIDSNHVEYVGDLQENTQSSESADIVELDVVIKQSIEQPKLANLKELTWRYEQAWQIYETRDEAYDEEGSLSKAGFAALEISLGILLKAGDALIGFHAVKNLEMFSKIPTQRRHADSYQLAVKSALLAHQPTLALALNRQALSRQMGYKATAFLLCYFIRYELWELATNLHATYLEFKDNLPGQKPWTSFLSDLDIPVLEGQVMSLSKFAHREHRKISDCLDRDPGLSNFTEGIIKHYLSRRGVQIDPKKQAILLTRLHKLVTPDPKNYILAIEQLLSMPGTVDAVGKHGRLAVEVYKEMRALFNEPFIPEAGVIRMLFQRSCETHFLRGARLLFDDQETFHGPADRIMLRSLMAEVSSAGDAKMFEQLLEVYNRRFLPCGRVDNRIFHQLLNLHFRRADPEEVVKQFDLMIKKHGWKPDVVCYNIIIATFSRVSNTESALQWYDKLLKSTVQPNETTYLTLMNMYAPGGDVQAIATLIKECEQKNIPMHASMVDSLVLAHIKNDDVEAAEEIVRNAMELELVGSRTRMWNYLLTAIALRKDPDRMNYVHQLMEEAGVRPDEFTYAALLQSLCVTGYPLLAFKMLRKVFPSRNVRVSALHYAIIIRGCIATKEYHQVLPVYSHMLRAQIRPNFSSQTMLHKAMSFLDVQNHDQSGGLSEELLLARGEAFLHETLKSLDPKDIAAQEPVMGLGLQALDEAFFSNYFEHIIYLYGSHRVFDKVSEHVERYLTILGNHRRSLQVDMPIKMVTALMAVHARQHDHAEIERCWHIASEKVAPIAGRVGADRNQPLWVLPARRFILCQSLLHYMKSLQKQGRIQDIIAIVKRLQEQGFDLDNKCWNLYVQSLAVMAHEMGAFVLAERELMSGWTGWPIRGGLSLAIKGEIHRKQPRQIETRKRLPTYKTLVVLAGAYMKLRSQHAFSANKDEWMEQLGEAAPRAVRAVHEMPRIDDPLQSKYLKRW